MRIQIYVMVTRTNEIHGEQNNSDLIGESACVEGLFFNFYFCSFSYMYFELEISLTSDTMLNVTAVTFLYCNLNQIAS